MSHSGKRLIAAAALAGAILALVAGLMLITQMANSTKAEAKSDACRAACEETFGQCYRDTADRDNCTNSYKQCLAACING